MSLNIDEIITKQVKAEKFFFSKIPYEVWTCKTLPDSAVRLYAAYHSFCGNKQINLGKSMTFVSQHKLADLLGWGVKKVKRNQKSLKEQGFIREEKRGFKRSSKIYLNKIMPRKEPDSVQNPSNDDSNMETKKDEESLSREDMDDLLNR